MIKQEKIDEILSRSDIVDVIGDFVELTKKGVNYQACCPFHNENTPSFSVSKSKQIYKCFGCGKGGNVISFLMEHEKMTYSEALKYLAKRYKIEIEEITLTPEEQAKQEEQAKRKISIITALRIVEDFYTENLNKNSTALEYLSNERKFSSDIINTFRLGLATGNDLLQYCNTHGLKTEFLTEIGILKEGKKGLYDPFYNRIIFPLWDRFGNIIGFTGRILPEFTADTTPKYKNSEESEIYHKSKTLYAYHIAYNEIRNTKTVYIVEGNTDCMRMHAVGKINTVAQMGTALTAEQISLLKKADAETVILCYDSDAAGQKATVKNGAELLKAGFAVEILFTGTWETSEKNDVDNLFKNSNTDEYEEYERENKRDYINSLFNHQYHNAATPTIKSNVIKNFAELLASINENTAKFYIDDIGKRHKIKKLLSDAYHKAIKTPIVHDNNKNSDFDDSEDEMIKRYGFTIENGKYWFQRIGRYGSNFILKPLFHVESVTKPKRIFSIINEYGIAHEIELEQKDLISLAAFKLKVEGLGNFLWTTDEISLTQLKSYLYDNTDSCKEIDQLGWQRQGFWAWSNGIFYNKTFYPIDEMGIIKLPNDMGNYYLPALSNFYKSDKDIFEAERRFVFRPESKTSMYDFSKMMVEVFGDNAIVLILFYINTLFRDIITKKTNNFPLLNLFGLKGTGKSELYHTMLQAFGQHPMAPNINSTSKAALGDHVAQYSNALCAIDEYKNSLELEKIEFLKGLYNSTGRTRMNMEKDKKKETTRADVGIVIAGQEMPTADIALFSRLLYTVFTQTEHSPEDVKKYEFLKETAANGFTNITHEILSLREHFKDTYDESYEIATQLLTEQIHDIHIIEDRMLKNWLMILTGYIAVADKVKIYFKRDKVVELFAKCIENQNAQTQSGSEISIFWGVVEYLYKENLIENEIDFVLSHKDKLKIDKSPEPFEFMPPKNILFIDTGRIFALYRKHAKQIIEQPLPLQSIEFYVRNSKEYLGSVASVRFKVKNPETGRMENYETNDPFFKKTQKYKITRALAFDYDKLQQNGLNIHITEIEEDNDNDNDNKIF